VWVKVGHFNTDFGHFNTGSGHFNAGCACQAAHPENDDTFHGIETSKSSEKAGLKISEVNSTRHSVNSTRL
jgi:hypothetical protein